ncbi:MAG: hypothetical protein NTW03_04025, partial [Verrucomicrobia bacterium]|nr:hypothetical protein [Verrucomicrobiota bacterium]
APITCGSGGNYHGGAGGRVVRLTAGGTLPVDGAISVSGNDAYWTDGGGGAGGSIFLSAATLAGTGSIRADGGAGGSPSGDGGGGGGRLALLADTLSFSGSLSAVGGSGFQAGGAGTIFTRVAAEPYGRLVLHNAGRAGYTRFGVTNWAAGQVFALSLAGAARLVPLTPITVSQLEITDAAMLTHDRMGQPLRVNVLGSAVIGTGASIDVAGAGYNDTNPGPGRGGYTSWGAGGGGGYGGRGGQGLPGEGSGGKTYGIFSEPLEFGSAAGGRGTYGGGSVRLAVGGRLTVDGTITADAQGGNAAGGSVYLVCAELAGGGDILARGSAAASSDSGGGGGGRIAVHAGTMSFLGTTSVAGGPGGFEGGGAGTIYLTNSAVLCGSVRSATQQGLAGASISATGGYTTFTDAQGGFLLLLPSDWSGSVSATATNQILTPATRALTHVTTPRFGIDFAAETLRRPALSFQNSAGLLRLSWDSQSGPNYQVYSTPDFINWSAYGPLHPGTGNPVTLDCPMTNSPGLFFRVQAIGN